MNTTNLNRFRPSPERIEELQALLFTRYAQVKDDIQDRSLNVASRACEKLAAFSKDAPLTVLQERSATLEKGADYLSKRREALRRPGIENYDDLNVEQVKAALPLLSKPELEKTRHYETDNKSRVTVLREIDRLLEQ